METSTACYRVAVLSTSPQVWRSFDWRFLLRDPNLGRVWLAPECTHEAPALETAGIEVVPSPADGVDTVFADGRAFDASALERSLPPRTLVRIAFAAGRPGLAGARRLPFSTRRRLLEKRGWEVLSCAWAAPSLAWTKAYVEVSDRLGVDRTLTFVHRPRGTAARLKQFAARVIVRVGAPEMVCREGVVLARTPS